jgi:hypothetical protein
MDKWKEKRRPGLHGYTSMKKPCRNSKCEHSVTQLISNACYNIRAIFLYDLSTAIGIENLCFAVILTIDFFRPRKSKKKCSDVYVNKEKLICGLFIFHFLIKQCIEFLLFFCSLFREIVARGVETIADGSFSNFTNLVNL